ncbi:MAG: ABC transporter ATP-binding protein [Pirellulales bacterium]|nr:ABC transporter ATP-binding protein [Pirellulales bacterium]
MRSSVISVSRLTKTFVSGWWKPRLVPALGGVTLSVSRGEIFGLLGPNGAGKTTLIKVLLGIVRKTAGQAEILALPAGSLAARRRIGYLPENNRIPRHHTAATALEYYGGLSGLSPRQVKERQPALLDLVGLGRWADTPVRQFSKGMQQRLGLAQAILHDPELVILDEPTDGVDPVGRAELRDVLLRLKQAGKTIFLNSHHLQEMELVCDQVAIMNKGEVVRQGRLAELTAHSQLRLTMRGNVAAVQHILVELGHGKAMDQLGSDVPRSSSETNSAESTPPAPLASTIISHSSEQLTVNLPDLPQAGLDQIIDALRAANVSVVELTRHRQTLESTFLAALEKT